MNSQDVDQWLSAILSKDAVTFEDAYWGARPSPSEAVPRILQVLREAHEPYTRGKLLELLGESGDMGMVQILEAELCSADQSIRDWARGGIDALERGEAWQKNPKYL